MGNNPLPYNPMTDDLLWLRIDEDNVDVRQTLASRKILHAEPGQVLISLGPDESAQAVHAHGAHGHLELLTPSTNLLRPAIHESLDDDVMTAESPQ